MSQSKSLFSYLSKTRQALTASLGKIFFSRRHLDESLYEDIEDHLIMADLGILTTQAVIKQLKEQAIRRNIASSAELSQILKEVLTSILSNGGAGSAEQSIASPEVILMVGVNGVGKTTTLAKLAHYLQLQGKTVMLAAGDTYRAAAIEQLQTWGKRLNVPVIAQPHGSDAAAVAYDALHSARARQIDYLLIDSAGRQHTHDGLMDQLQKIKRVLAKSEQHAPHQVLLTVDAGNGQNVLSQVEHFHKAMGLTGICVTKLEGTAKGGVVFAVVERFGLPIKFLGVGENLEDFRPFVPDEFADALIPDFSEQQNQAGG